MTGELGHTKSMILHECLNRECSWSEIVLETQRSEPAILVHINELIRNGFIIKTNNKKYRTTKQGIKLLTLIKQRTKGLIDMSSRGLTK